MRIKPNSNLVKDWGEKILKISTPAKVEKITLKSELAEKKNNEKKNNEAESKHSTPCLKKE